MRGVLGYAGWRWLFLIEGLFTSVSYAIPRQDGILIIDRSAHRPLGFWSHAHVSGKVQDLVQQERLFHTETSQDHRQQRYATPCSSAMFAKALTVIRDDPAKGGMHNRQALTIKDIWHCVKDYDMWPIYLLGLLFGIPAGPVGQYLTLSFRGLGFNVIQTNLLAIPQTVLGALTMLGVTAISELVNNRSFVAMAEDAWLIPCFIALITLPDPINPWVYFAIATVLLAYP